MKNRILHKFIPVLVVGLMSSFTAMTQGLSLTLKIENERSTYFEPLFYSLKLETGGLSGSDIRAPFQRYLPELQYFDKKAGAWQKLDGSDVSYSYRYDPIKRGTRDQNPDIEIKSQQSYKKDLVYLPVIGKDLDLNYQFKDQTRIRLRAVFYPEKGKRDYTIVSNEVKLKLKPKGKQNRLAAKALETFPIPHFIFEVPILKEYWGAYQIESGLPLYQDAQRLVRDFPESDYAQWANLFLCRYFLNEAEYGKNEKASELAKAETYSNAILESENLLVVKYLKPVLIKLEEKKYEFGLYRSDSDYFDAVEKLNALFRSLGI